MPEGQKAAVPSLEVLRHPQRSPAASSEAPSPSVIIPSRVLAADTTAKEEHRRACEVAEADTIDSRAPFLLPIQDRPIFRRPVV